MRAPIITFTGALGLDALSLYKTENRSSSIAGKISSAKIFAQDFSKAFLSRSARECAEAHSFLLLFFRQWKGEDKFCSNSFGTDHIDIFIVCLNNFFYD